MRKKVGLFKFGNYLTLGASMGLQMVDLEPLFKVTVAVCWFSILGTFHTHLEKINLGSSDLYADLPPSRIGWHYQVFFGKFQSVF